MQAFSKIFIFEKVVADIKKSITFVIPKSFQHLCLIKTPTQNGRVNFIKVQS